MNKCTYKVGCHEWQVICAHKTHIHTSDNTNTHTIQIPLRIFARHSRRIFVQMNRHFWTFGHYKNQANDKWAIKCSKWTKSATIVWTKWIHWPLEKNKRRLILQIRGVGIYIDICIYTYLHIPIYRLWKRSAAARRANRNVCI